MDTMTYASVAVIPGSVAQVNRRLMVREAEFNPFDLSYINPRIRIQISRLETQYAELREELTRLGELLKHLGKTRQPFELSNPDQIETEAAFQDDLDRLR